MQIAFTATDQVRAAVGRVGRTEDAQFSPDGSRLALAGLAENRLLVLRLQADFDSDPPAILLSDALEIDSASLKYPHGLFWADDRTLIVANRSGEVTIFELPPELPTSARIRLDPVRSIGADLGELVRTPGSISLSDAGLGLVELLVCNNYVHHVSRHLLDRRDGYRLIASEILLDEGLEVPDGVADSPSRRWIAVSNHDHHCVFVFRNDDRLNCHRRPDGVLRGILYPHGLRFAPDGMSLLVADAGAPFVHVFASEDGDWSGERGPATSIQVVDEKTFRRGSYNPQEGGPKGIDVTRDGRLLVASCEQQPLAFFDMRTILGPAPAAAARDQAAEAERAREVLLRYLVASGSRVHEATAAIRRTSERQIRMVVDSRSWRMTAPLRWVNARLAKATRRRPRHLR